MRKPRIQNEEYIDAAMVLSVVFERAVLRVRRQQWAVSALMLIISLACASVMDESIASASSHTELWTILTVAGFLAAIVKPFVWLCYLGAEPASNAPAVNAARVRGSEAFAEYPLDGYPAHY